MELSESRFYKSENMVCLNNPYFSSNDFTWGFYGHLLIVKEEPYNHNDILFHTYSFRCDTRIYDSDIEVSILIDDVKIEHWAFRDKYYYSFRFHIEDVSYDILNLKNKDFMRVYELLRSVNVNHKKEV